MKAGAPAPPEAEPTSGGWWDTALGLARDAVPVASTVTQYSFAAAKRGTAAAAGISGAMISGGGQVAAAGAAALGATGVVSAPVASRVGAGVRVGTAAGPTKCITNHNFCTKYLRISTWGLERPRPTGQSPSSAFA